MTTLKAIEILTAHRKYYKAAEQQLQAAPLCEALEMAIEALQENKEHKETVAHIDARLQHLLQSDFIKSFDEKCEMLTGYKRDIKEADRLGALIDVYAGRGGFEFSISQLKDLIKDRESFLQGWDDTDEVFKRDIAALETAITAMRTHDKAAKIINESGTEYDIAAAVVRVVDYLSENLPTIIDKIIEHFPQAIAKAAMMINNEQEQGEAESLNKEIYNRLQDIIKLYPYPLGGKNFEEWDGSGDYMTGAGEKETEGGNEQETIY